MVLMILVNFKSEEIYEIYLSKEFLSGNPKNTSPQIN